MKKVIGALILALATIVLVACSNVNMDGTYYTFYSNGHGNYIVSNLWSYYNRKN
ncbi:hypothetical protein [Streptococcus mutans]|uniref:hypothetical protein n=1 Tax=Streptococcus mutans TaxID=1309 RepID=UPI00034C9ABB|nr:hypothetical protein [Streptococcus mutans]